MSNLVYLLTSGDGSYGDEWVCHSVHLSRENAEKAKQIYETERVRIDGSSYHYCGTIEEWPTEEISPWKTIDSAPLNGTIVDLIEFGERCPNCWYNYVLKRWERFWIDSSDKFAFIEVINPTHWMEIPKPPK